MTSAIKRTSGGSNIITLPPPKLRSRYALERALFERRSIREYTRAPVTLSELAQLLWSVQGITGADGLRATPSAGGAYPLEIYAVVEHGAEIAAGIYHYRPGPGVNEHHLVTLKRGKFGKQLCELSTQQEFIKKVAVNIVLASVTERMEKMYGEMALRYVFMEMGHAAQNLHLQAEALGLGSVAIGYLQEGKVKDLLGCEADPLYMVSVGRKNGVNHE
ncbi:MAG: SagB/ThcOx family dehydrogenase [Calditrichota bacterium]